MKNSFYLVIPQQVNDPQFLASFSEAALNQWVSELPSANPGLATRLFQEMLDALIRVEMPAQKRLQALDILKNHFLITEDYLRSKLMQSGFPKGDTERKIFNVLVTIEKHLTIGYWSSARELTKRESGWLQGKSPALAVLRTIEGLSSIVISHYMMCMPIPNWIWIDLHSLYRLAVKLGKENSKISEQGGLFSGRTIESRYKQIIMLSLAFPSGLMQKEFLQVYQFAEKVCELVTIEHRPIPEQEMQCFVQTDEDLAPKFVATTPDLLAQQTDPAKIYLNLGKLFKVIKQADKYCSADVARFSSIGIRKNIDPNQKLSAELFEYLMQRWHGKEPHGTAFFSDRLDRWVAFGLDATHDLQDLSLAEPPQDLEMRAQTHSDRALTCTFERQEGVLSIGTLVSLRRLDAHPHQRSLGVVCKILLPKQDSKIIFEITMIAAQSYAVSYVHADAPENTERKKALLYVVKSQAGEKSFIIMESFMVKDGDLLKLFMGADIFSIILMGRRNLGLGFWQFECRRFAENAHPSIKETKKGYDFI